MPFIPFRAKLAPVPDNPPETADLKKSGIRVVVILILAGLVVSPAQGALRTDQQYREATGLAESVASSRFTVFSSERGFSRQAIDRLEEALARVQSDLHLKRILTKRCLVFIWEDRTDYLEKASAMGFSGLGMTGGFAVSADGRSG